MSDPIADRTTIPEFLHWMDYDGEDGGMARRMTVLWIISGMGFETVEDALSALASADQYVCKGLEGLQRDTPNLTSIDGGKKP
jgi:hypothetical protein